jgi:DnaA-homolog protein
MEQLIFELATPEPPTFDNFLPGRNREAVAALRRMAAGGAGETGLVLWGPPGAGKTHLLQAAAVAAGARPVLYCPEPAAFKGDAELHDALVLIDDVDRADAPTQGRLFTLYNALRAAGGALVVTALEPPARLSLREDLRTRLGWGLVHEVLPLTDDDKPLALATYAKARGFTLSEDVIAYLLAHGQRDMTSLTAALGALDRHSLATKRPITLPLLREWLQRRLPLPAASAGGPPR